MISNKIIQFKKKGKKKKRTRTRKKKENKKMPHKNKKERKKVEQERLCPSQVLSFTTLTHVPYHSLYSRDQLITLR
jgi:hypothetical protein